MKSMATFAAMAGLFGSMDMGLISGSSKGGGVFYDNSKNTPAKKKARAKAKRAKQSRKANRRK